MSFDIGYLALRLEGPLQSWGMDSQYNRRNTGLMPTKSGIAGMCCAALGLTRGSVDECEFLESFNKLKMTAISIERDVQGKKIMVRRFQDYHTVKDTRTAEGKNKDCHITYRQYLTDASFGVLLKGGGIFLKKISCALEDPVWGICLGRKTCIPSKPVLAGFRIEQEDALSLLIGDRSIEEFTRQEDVEAFMLGKDSLQDAAATFNLRGRVFSPRRVTTVLAK